MSVTQIKDPRVVQLIDANLDRAREGLRVLEEWCRYGIYRKDLVIKIKDLRQQLGYLHKESYKRARALGKDKGLGLTHPIQETRQVAEEIISANCGRVQEALRVLEEFTKEIDPILANYSHKVRYETYELELTIIKASTRAKRRKSLENCKLCLITKESPNLLNIVRESLHSGVRMVQYRNKKANDINKLNEAKELSSLCKKFNALFIINDRIDIAIASNADGVHLGENDIPPKVAREILGEEMLIGVTTHSLENLISDESDYIGLGPIYTSSTKPDLKASGLDYVREASEKLAIPWFAIGGINESNANEVISAGAKKIAVIDAIMGSENPSNATSNLLKNIQ